MSIATTSTEPYLATLGMLVLVIVAVVVWEVPLGDFLQQRIRRLNDGGSRREPVDGSGLLLGAVLTLDVGMLGLLLAELLNAH